MSRRRQGLTAALAALLLAVGAMAGCTDEGSKDAFCDRVADVPLLVDVLAELDGSDPGGSRQRIDRALKEFRALEVDAPGEIRADMARLRQGIELVLDAVKNNPDDLPGAREEILGQQDELAGLAQAGERVASYVGTECDVNLDPGGIEGNTGSSPGGTSSTTTEG